MLPSGKTWRTSSAQNGHGHGQLLPRFQRRKVSAVRDFPPGCGRVTLLVNPGPPIETDISYGHDDENPVGTGAPGLSEDLQEVVAATMRDESMGVLFGGDFLAVTEKLVRKYPTRRRVSAVREFPPNCGRHAPRLGDVEFMSIVCAPPRRESFDPERFDSRTSAETLSAKMSNDDGFRCGDSSESMEASGSEVTRREVRLEDSERGASNETWKEMAEIDVQDGDLDKSNSVSKVAREVVVVVQSKKSGEFLDSSMEKKAKVKEVIISRVDDTNEADPKEPSEVSRLKKSKSKLKRRGSKANGNNAQPESEDVALDDETETKVDREQEQKPSEAFFEDKLIWWDHEVNAVAENGDDVEALEDLGKEMVVFSELKADKNQRADRDKSEKNVVRDSPSSRKRKKLDTASPPRVVGQKTKMTARKKVDMNDPKPRPFKKKSPKTVCHDDWDWEEVKSPQHGEEDQDLDLAVVPAPSPIDFYYPPLGPDREESSPRRRVKQALRMYHTALKKYQKAEEGKPKDSKSRPRFDLKAATLLKSNNQYVNGSEHILGPVPGVEVGDRFLYRAELNVIGLHRQSQGGIDFTTRNGKTIALSVVSSGGYADDLEDSDVVVYTGQGGNVMNSGKDPEDQKLERGNLGLKNSMDEKNPVRFTRQESPDGGKTKVYVYAGLYLVTKYWQIRGPHGKLVYQFQLERIPGQPPLGGQNEVIKSGKKIKPREGVCVEDISNGKEPIPICAVNTLNDERPPRFKYVTKMVYSDWYHPTPMEGCGCSAPCSDSSRCSCAVKNGGNIPFNERGEIVEMKSVVYECGPSCKCPPSCPNRVTQNGIRFQLEIFKTERTGWGVRSPSPIPSGSFICEYLGELLSEKEADRRTGNDEYLFDIGNNYNDNTLWEGAEDGAECFTIDAAEYGNVGRFINHSCNPNLYAQNVLWHHSDKRIPRIMLFAAENIPALQELTYHYNYTIDTVRDSQGNVKKKNCYCGAEDCSGRLY